MPGTPIVRVVDVSKRFNLHHDKSLKERLVNRATRANEDFWALRNVAFDLDESNTLGLIGANGSGKSTLLKVVAGILTPTSGYVERRGRMAALLELGAMRPRRMAPSSSRAPASTPTSRAGRTST